MTKKLKEAFVFEDRIPGSTDSRINEEQGLIRGVKVLGRVSNNAPATIGVKGSDARFYTYPQATIREAASLYEGVRVNIDHPGFRYDSGGQRQAVSMQRELEDQFGWLENVTVTEEGLYADLHYFRSHPMAARVVEMARRKPDNIGLSHVALTKPVTKPDGSVEIEKIIEVMSVDLIGDKPGTVSSLFESTFTQDTKEIMEMDPVQKALDAKKEEDEKVVVPGTGKKPVSEMEDQEDEIKKGEAKTAEMEDQDPASPGETVMAGIRDAILELLTDDSLDEASLIEKVNALISLGTRANDLVSGETPAAEMGDGDKKKEVATPESRAILLKLDKLEKGQQALIAENQKLKAESLLQLSGIKPNQANIKAVLACESQSEINLLISGMEKGFAAPSVPRSGSRVFERAGNQPPQIDKDYLGQTARKILGR